MAAQELALVREAAREFELETGEGDVSSFSATSGKSIEEAARLLRLSFFEECAARHACSRIFLAHHALDQAETILMNLFRGCGLAGMTGMAYESKVGSLYLLRPLLRVSPSELREYLSRQAIPFVEDPSNRDLAFTRNRVRHQLLPIIEETLGARALASLLRTADLLADEEHFLRAQVPTLGTSISVGELKALHPALQRRAILKWLRGQKIPQVGVAEVEAVLSLLDIQNGPAKVNLPSDCHARRRSGQIFLEGKKSL